jgi:hypothetical protein
MRGGYMFKLAVILTLVITVLAFTGYAAKDTHVMRHWHPMFVEKWVNQAGYSWFGHVHTAQEPEQKNGALVRAPVTTCWDYDFLEMDCDGPDHYKSFLDGQRIGAYKGDETILAPPRAKACATDNGERFCVSDYEDDGETVWLDTGRNLEEHTLVIGCPGPRSLTTPCTSRY